MIKELCILIPTYDRLEFLSEQLARISSGVKLFKTRDNQTQVRLEILDNCSTDYTEDDLKKTVENIYHDSSAINVHRNPSNIGFSRNVIAGVAQLRSAATSSFVWILSDDDLIDPYSFALLLDFIDESSPISEFPILLPWFCSGIGPANTIRGINECKSLNPKDCLLAIHANALISSWIYPYKVLKDCIMLMSDQHKPNSFFQIPLNARILLRTQFVTFHRCIGIERPNLVWRFDLIDTFVRDRSTAIHEASSILGHTQSASSTLNRGAFVFLSQRIFLYSLYSRNIQQLYMLIWSGIKFNLLSPRAFLYLLLACISSMLPARARSLLFRSYKRDYNTAANNQALSRMLVLGIGR